MKRKLLRPLLNSKVLAIPAAALMLGASHAAQVGINFQDNYSGTAYAPLTDPSGAFGIPLANWINAPSVENSAVTPIATNGTFALPGGGDLQMAWSCKNTYSLYAEIPGTGDNQVIYGYLDDTDYGYTVTLSGLRSFASSFTIQTIATSDNATGFQDVNLMSITETNVVQYPAIMTPDFATGAWATSTVSTAFVTLNGNDSVTIRGVARSGSMRSCLSGILLEFTPGINAPLIEVNPQAPVGNLYPGGSFVLNALASGTANLHYQWRQDGTDIPGANSPSFTNSSTVVGDSGNYDVVVTNAYGAVTSAVAAVTILDVTPPVITQGPLSQSLYQGYPATFRVAATGGLLAYQWKSNNVVIPAATNATYTIPAITTNDAGTYTVEVNNPVGPVASASATLTVKVPVPGSYEAVVVQTQPLVWFRASETQVPLIVTGSAANSGSTGATDDGVAKRYVTFQQAGAITGDANKSALFSGGQMIDVPFDAALNPGSFTVELWVNPSDVSTSARSPLYNRGASLGDGFLFFAHNGNTKWQFRTYVGTSGKTINSTVDVVAGVWTHLVGVFDATSGMMHFYVNGVEQGTGLDATGHTSNNALQLRLGAGRNDLDAGDLFWKGGIDEVAIYNTVLSPAAILAHYDNGTNASRVTPYANLVQASSPVGYWRLNDPSGPIAPTPKNSGTLGSAWDGAYVGDILPATVGPRPPLATGLEATNLAVVMTNGHLSAPLCTNLNVNTITVAGWLKRDAIPSGSDLGFPCWLGDGGMHIENTSGRPTGELRYHWKNTGAWGWGSGLVVPADVWTFVAMVVEPAKITFFMSENGVLKSSSRNFTHDPLAVTTALGFGRNPNSLNRTYIGGQDEFAVYNRALSQAEINTLFMIGTGAPLQLGLVPGGYVEDTKPVGTPHHGANFGTTWSASSTDTGGGSTTRNGVQTFNTTNATQIVTAADPDFNSTTGTIMFWLKAGAPIPGPGTEGAMLLDRRNGAGTVLVLNDAGQLLVQCYGGVNTFATGYLPDDNWHHVAVTYDQSVSGTIEIYVDGVSYGSQGNTGAWSWPTNQPIEIGRSHDSYWKRFNGQMDDVRIYDRILNSTEVQSVFTSDAVVDTSALKLRYNFGNLGVGQTVTWPFGTLLSSPVLGPSAVWTPVSGATPPAYPILPTNNPSLFFRATP